MFSIIWKHVARMGFLALFGAADSEKRKALLLALQRIMLELTADPENAGESRNRGRRIVHAAPLAAMIRVDRNRMRVVLLRVWEY